jgi:hypothetical protein
MDEILRGYEVSKATWFYLSLLLIVAVFFRFGRFFSLRNLDLALLLSMSPGILLVQEGYQLGYAWLFIASGILLARLCADSNFTRRPRLEPNLNPQGLTFLCVAAFVFLTAAAIKTGLPQATVETVERSGQLTNREDAGTPNETEEGAADKQLKAGPAAPVLTAPIIGSVKALAAANGVAEHDRRNIADIAARLTAMVAHLAVVLALVWFAKLHFNDTNAGLAMATLYLLLPCTSYEVGELNHVLPSALILWALVAYRRPMLAGGLMGLACGSLFFPIFLLPLWATFYGWRGALRFGMALVIVSAVLLASLAFTSADAQSFVRQTFGFIDWSALAFQGGSGAGYWSEGNDVYRIPVFVAFLVLTAALTIWPMKKNMEHLIAHSTAIVVGTQFWYPQQGGIYLLWYLPLLLVVAFRPSLTHLLPPEVKTASADTQATPSTTPVELVGAAPPNQRLFR